ncbi:MAG: glycosyltransferase family 9 protein, partial [Candidatus Brocadiales bacterium]|nr:glycosyltransferase family 9 protein [Candidatus Brocadiales bacterium]
MKQCGEHALDLINKLIIKLLSFILLPARPEQFSPEKIKRIVIYGTVGIGNMVLYSPFFKALRNHFPKAHIHLIIFTDKRGSEQVLQKSNLVDEISTWVVSELSNVQLYNVLPQVFQRMKKWKADLLISRYNTRHIGYNLVTVLSRAPYRIGHVFEDKWTSDYDYLFNYPVEIDKDEYERDMYLRLGESIGVRTQEKKLFFCMDGNDEQRAHEFLTMHGINTGKPFVTVQVGTSKFQKWKKWDTDKWIKLIKTLLENKVRVVVLGLADEWERLRNAFGDRDKEPIVAAGKMTLQQTAAIIKKSRLLVCNDSALMHIAAAVDT